MLLCMLFVFYFSYGKKLYHKANLTNTSHVDHLLFKLKPYISNNSKLITCIGFNEPELRQELKSLANISHADYDIYGGPLNPQSHLYYTEGRPEMLLDLDYGIEDSHCKDICLLSHKIILYIPRQLIRVSEEGQIEFDLNVNRMIQFLKDNNTKGSKLYALVPDDISEKHMNLLSNYLSNHKITTIRSIKGELSFDQSHLPFEKFLNVLGKPKKDSSTGGNINNITRERLLRHFNPLVFVDSDIYKRILKCESERNFLTISKIPLLQSIMAQVLWNLFKNDSIKLFSDDSYEHFRSFAISDINSTLELGAINHLYSLILREMDKSPKSPTADIIDNCLDQTLEFYKKTAINILGKVTDKAEKRVKTILEKSAQLLTSIPPSQLLKKHLESDKLTKGLHVGLGLTAMVRRPGRGNLQWYTNYQYGPLTFTLGFANDKDLCPDNIPSFRIQPKVHLNVNL